MDILFTNRKLLSIDSESVQKVGQKPAHYFKKWDRYVKLMETNIHDFVAPLYTRQGYQKGLSHSRHYIQASLV